MALLTSSSVIDQNIITEIGQLVTTVTGWLTSNSILLIFLTVSLAGIGITMFKRLKGTVR